MRAHRRVRDQLAIDVDDAKRVAAEVDVQRQPCAHVAERAQRQRGRRGRRSRRSRRRLATEISAREPVEHRFAMHHHRFVFGPQLLTAGAILLAQHADLVGRMLGQVIAHLDRGRIWRKHFQLRPDLGALAGAFERADAIARVRAIDAQFQHLDALGIARLSRQAHPPAVGMPVEKIDGVEVGVMQHRQMLPVEHVLPDPREAGVDDAAVHRCQAERGIDAQRFGSRREFVEREVIHWRSSGCVTSMRVLGEGCGAIIQ